MEAANTREEYWDAAGVDFVRFGGRTVEVVVKVEDVNEVGLGEMAGRVSLVEDCSMTVGLDIFLTGNLTGVAGAAVDIPNLP